MNERMASRLASGLYDQLITERLWQESLAGLEDGASTLRALGAGESARRLADEIARQMAEMLDGLGGEGEEKVRQQLALVNALLVNVRERTAPAQDDAHLSAPSGAGDAVSRIEPIRAPLQVLHAVHGGGRPLEAPETGLSLPWLFTAAKQAPALLSELRRELSSCDQVDVLMSFITWSGVRKLEDILHSATAVGADGRPGTRLRVLTTTYVGATEVRALDLLARLPGCEVRVSLDGARTRLHAKAWIFQRRSGFGSAYVGSANLSLAALMGGLEWTVKFTQRGQTDLFESARANFETLWNDPEFQRYDPENPGHRQALTSALQKERGVGKTGTDDGLALLPSFFDLQPRSYQQAMLEGLANERAQGRWRNLLVAATGTGKTVVAALDYRNLCRQEGGKPRLLFVAHRAEILHQARRTYREVLRDNSFGELLAGGAEPDRQDHLFATIDSVTSRKLLESRGAEHWHVVVIDECHRIAAQRFDSLAGSVRPRVLLGLTATPERSDGQSILPYFDNRPDGSPAVELRLWRALELQLLCPFEYYACDDETDFSSVDWGRPGEVSAVERLVTGNDVRARLVINEWTRLAANPRAGRALAFCVSVAHAQFMTRKFNEAGIPAACVVGETPVDERRRAPRLLEQGEISVIVTCDLYNEGVDLPFVDTLLLLRPTQSPVVFQQQIGRGLRLFAGKHSCLILDFVGQFSQEFRFDTLLSGITGMNRSQLLTAVEEGFPLLPPGCLIRLQQKSRLQILESLRRLVQHNWRRLTTELQAHAALNGRQNVGLADFLSAQRIELTDIYRSNGNSGWSSLKRSAGLLRDEPGPEEAYFGRRFAELLHVDDPLRLKAYMQVCEPGAAAWMHGAGPVPAGLSVDFPGNAAPEAAQGMRLSQMLAYQVDGRHDQLGSGEDFAARLARTPASRAELKELLQVLAGRDLVSFRPVPGMEDTPLCLHARYEIREILTAVGWLTSTRRTPFQAGVLALKERKTELLFVTLDKREGYHERISYRDYAVAADLFHWQSQNSAGPDTAAGQRYLGSRENGDGDPNAWRFQLFVREAKGEPYHACGPVILESAEGRKPMSIVWRLQVPLPQALFQRFSVLRAV